MIQQPPKTETTFTWRRASREPVIEQPRIYTRPLVTETRRPAPTNPLPDPRVPEQKKGWMSLFGGRPRYDTLPAAYPARPQGHGQAAAHQVEPEQTDSQEDLEIPSFLRRLAN